MSDPLSIGAGIVAFLGIAGRILKKYGERQNASPQIRQILTEAEAFQAMVILLQGLLLERSEEALNNRRLLKVATLMRVLKGSTGTFEKLDKELDGLVEAELRIGKSNVGKWSWRQGDIVAMLRNLESHKLTLRLILDILNCHQEQQEKQEQRQERQEQREERQALQDQFQAQKDILVERRRQQQLIQQQNALLLNFIMGNSGTLPISNMQQQQSVVSMSESVTSRQQIFANVAINTTAGDIRSVDQPVENQQPQRVVTGSYSSAAPEALVRYNTNLDAECNVEINYEQILIACRVYKRIYRKEIPSSLTLSEINISSRSVLDFKLKQSSRPVLDFKSKQSSSPLRYTYQFIRAPGATLLASQVQLNEALMAPVQQDNRRVITVLLERGANIDTKDGNGAAPLHLAALKGHVRTAGLLLRYGAEVNLKRNDGRTPLQLAALNGHVKTIPLLLSDGAEINEKSGWDGSTPLELATSNGHFETIRLLLNHGGEINSKNALDGSTPLHLAVSKGHIETIELLLSHGAEIHVNSGLDGSTPLHLAVVEGNVDAIQLLLRHGAQANAKSGLDGSTPLHLAASKGHLEATKLLLRHGAEMNLERDDGRTALQLASSKGHVSNMQIFLSHRDSNGATPLHLAASKGHVEAIQLLLSHGADIDARSRLDGSTPLHLAVLTGHVEVIQLLLRHGARIYAKNGLDGSTPLHLAVSKGHVEITKLLLSHGADVNLKMRTGDTPLHSAARWGRQEIAKELLAYGADINVKSDLNGETPMQYAARYGHSEIKTIFSGYEDMVRCETSVSYSRAGSAIRRASGVSDGAIEGIEVNPRESPEVKPLSGSEEQGNLEDIVTYLEVNAHLEVPPLHATRALTTQPNNIDFSATYIQLS